MVVCPSRGDTVTQRDPMSPSVRHSSVPCSSESLPGFPVIRRIRVGTEDDRGTLAGRLRAQRVAAYLLDPGAGNGVAFDWSLARDLGRRVIVAGGLCSANVAQAIRAAAPYGVDVSSGIERAPGEKDHDETHAFIRAVRKEDATTIADR